MKLRSSSVKLSIFSVLMVAIMFGLGVVFSQVRFASENTYHAVFTSASGMLPGSKVRIAGVPVGSVSRVTVGQDHLAHVDFDVDQKYPVYRSTLAAIRYENLVGDRYLELGEGPGDAQRLRDGGTLPLDHTKPALDLDLLLGGFKPLLRGLDPTQVNDLTAALLQVFQGQGGTLVTLLNSSGEFGKTLADRDALIGSVINNLQTVLSTIDAHNSEFDTTLTELQRLISGLAADKDPIGAALPRLAGATSDLQDLLKQARPDLQNDFDQLGKLSTNLNNNTDDIQWILDRLPDTYKKLTRIGSYGSFLNMYICGTNILANAPDGQDIEITLPGLQTTGRCSG
ncbi:MCE family protein [Nocardia stercoris]|uniref:MCE family protein n=1 Tax=Nocardia stercoris TaxID=2483361 RepID=A0A3M2KRH1_9NOCA|nr:MCE family protein [Nocardia stercoris]RMI28242.1 MCE family protein [Nocardia stercoris]